MDAESKGSKWGTKVLRIINSDLTAFLVENLIESVGRIR